MHVSKPARITAAYVFFGVLWILLTDRAVEAVVALSAPWIQTLKGLVFVFATGLVVYLLLRRYEHRHEAQKCELRANERRFRSLVENLDEAICLLEEDGTVMYASASTERLTGLPAEVAQGENVMRFVHPDDVDTVQSALDKLLSDPHDPVAVEVRLRRRNGSYIRVEAEAQNRLSDASVGGIVLNARDVTERRQMEHQLRQSQKMEAVGRLAGGIAHDFNNLITVIAGYLAFLKEETGHSENAENALAATDRAAALCRQLLTFTRQRAAKYEPLDLNAVVRGVESMLDRVIGEDVNIVLRLDETVCPVEADESQIEQVVMNLSVNARDAMPEGGTLTIETGNVDLDEEYARTHLDTDPGRYVMLAVTDTGTGMPRNVVEKVFEPFFTTKAAAQGTGLGLSTVYGIVKQVNGHIWVYSEPNQGTVFKIYLPQTSRPLKGGRGPRAIPSPKFDRGGQETVLVIEDEPAVRLLAAKILERRGYSVLAAESGEEAIDILAGHDGPIDLVVSDIVLPGLAGEELLESLRRARPGVRLLFMSGYAKDEALRRLPSHPGLEFIEKPFTPPVFARKVREVLDAGAARPGL